MLSCINKFNYFQFSREVVKCLTDDRKKNIQTLERLNNFNS